MDIGIERTRDRTGAQRIDERPVGVLPAFRQPERKDEDRCLIENGADAVQMINPVRPGFLERTEAPAYRSRAQQVGPTTIVPLCEFENWLRRPNACSMSSYSWRVV